MKFVSNRSGQEPKTKYFLRSFCGQSADTTIQHNGTALSHHSAEANTARYIHTHEPHHHFWTHCVLEVTLLASSQTYHWTFAHVCTAVVKSLVNKVLCYFIVCMSYQAPVIIILGHPPGSQQSVVATMLADSVCLNYFFFLSVQPTSGR